MTEQIWRRLRQKFQLNIMRDQGNVPAPATSVATETPGTPESVIRPAGSKKKGSIPKAEVQPRNSMIISGLGNLRGFAGPVVQTSDKYSKQPRKSIVFASSFENILERIGGFGKFQFLNLVLLLGMEIPAAFVMYLPIFIGAFPKSWTCDGISILYKDLCHCNGTRSSRESTIVTEWSFYCTKEWAPDTINSFQQVGRIIGVILLGKIADWKGRKNTFLATLLLMGVGNAVSAVANDPISYAVGRFLCGAGYQAYLQVTIVYAIEFQVPRWRAAVGALAPWGEGMIILAIMAYFIRPWRLLTLATSAPFLLIVIIYPLLPESPRWLLRNKRVKEAHRVLSGMARMNGVRDEISLGCIESLANQEVPKDGVVHQLGYLDFFKEKRLGRTTAYLMLIWGCWSSINFGVAFNTRNFPGNAYVNLAIVGLTDAIGYPISLWVTNKIGRRKSLCLFMIIAAFFLVTLAVLDWGWNLSRNPYVLVGLCFLGKLGIAGGRGSLRTVTGESFPTSMRTMGASMCGCAAGFASILAPQLAYLGQTQPSIPFFAFAILSTIGAGFSLLLTETTGKALEDNLPQHIQKIPIEGKRHQSKALRTQPVPILVVEDVH